MLGRSPKAEQNEERSINSWNWTTPGPTWSGVSVTQDSALQLLTVYGCVRMISDSISTLPVDVLKSSNGVSVGSNVPAWVKSPTLDLTFTEWCGQVLSSLLLEGNAYLLVNRAESGAIVELIPLNPCAVSVHLNAGRKVYTVNGHTVTQGVEIVHIKGLMLAGELKGMSPVEYARQTLGLGLAGLKYGAQFFDGEGNMPGVIEIPKVAQPDTLKSIASQWQRRRSSGGRGLPGVLDDGATWKPTGVTNEQAQFLGMRNFSAAEIAGQMFLLDPSDLGIPVEGTSLTYANLEQRNARRVQVTFLPWIVRLETALSALLGPQRYVKFNVSGLLRGDTSTRWATYAIAEEINASAATRGESPVLTTSEIRDYEDLGPLEAST